MMIGNPDLIAIEVGEIDSSLDQDRDYIQFRFVLFGQVIGDLDPSIPLLVATENMKIFLACRDFRRDESLRDVDSESFFAKTFTDFYEYDYKTQPVVQPNLRDRHHLSEVGGDSICDKFGVVVAEVAPGSSRILVKDLRSNSILLDRLLESSAIEEVGKQFLKWVEGRSDSTEK